MLKTLVQGPRHGYAIARWLDPLTLVLVSVLFAVVALVATAVPAMRAASVDPTNALRAD